MGLSLFHNIHRVSDGNQIHILWRISGSGSHLFREYLQLTNLMNVINLPSRSAPELPLGRTQSLLLRESDIERDMAKTARYIFSCWKMKFLYVLNSASLE